MRRVGAPKGGRVHWVLYDLSMYVRSTYTIKFRYECHDYVLYRIWKGKLIDVFIVKRTSKRCYRTLYYAKNGEIFYFSAKNYKHVCEFINGMSIDFR